MGSGHGIVTLSKKIWYKVVAMLGCVQMGAMMNEAFQAKEGLPPDLFPDSVPTYTGHYHKPHVVENTNIQYIGSPYQGWTRLSDYDYDAFKRTCCDVSASTMLGTKQILDSHVSRHS